MGDTPLKETGLTYKFIVMSVGDRLRFDWESNFGFIGGSVGA